MEDERVVEEVVPMANKDAPVAGVKACVEPSMGAVARPGRSRQEREPYGKGESECEADPLHGDPSLPGNCAGLTSSK